MVILIRSPLRADGAEAARQFPNVTHLIVPNLTHITAFSNEGYNVSPAGADFTRCTSNIVLRFVNQLSPGDAGCARKVRPIRTVPRFASSASELHPANPRNGNEGGTAELKLASAAAETIGDTVSRFFINFSGADSGLRGGSFTYEATGTGHSFTLKRVRWVNDLEVSGTIDWTLKSGVIASQVMLVQRGRSIGRLTITWRDTDTDAVATLTGVINGRTVVADRIAP